MAQVMPSNMEGSAWREFQNPKALDVFSSVFFFFFFLGGERARGLVCFLGFLFVPFCFGFVSWFLCLGTGRCDLPCFAWFD